MGSLNHFHQPGGMLPIILSHIQYLPFPLFICFSSSRSPPLLWMCCPVSKSVVGNQTPASIYFNWSNKWHSFVWLTGTCRSLASSPQEGHNGIGIGTIEEVVSPLSNNYNGSGLNYYAESAALSFTSLANEDPSDEVKSIQINGEGSPINSNWIAKVKCSAGAW